MEEHQCKDCQHFLQHYTLGRNRLLRVYCGHCTFAGIRKKQPDSKACKNFLPGPKQEDAFASREYLSKELLQFTLNLELLPEIEDQSDAG